MCSWLAHTIITVTLLFFWGDCFEYYLQKVLLCSETSKDCTSYHVTQADVLARLHVLSTWRTANRPQYVMESLVLARRHVMHLVMDYVTSSWGLNNNYCMLGASVTLENKMFMEQILDKKLSYIDPDNILREYLGWGQGCGCSFSRTVPGCCSPSYTRCPQSWG